MDQQQVFAQEAKKHIDSDPHYGIKDIMSNDEINTIITAIMTQRRDSLDLLFSFLWAGYQCWMSR